MSDDWVICKGCSLKYRVREQDCPRCDRPAEADQARWAADRSPGGRPAPGKSGFKAAITMIVLLLGAGAAAFFAPGFFPSGPAQKIARACEAKFGPDCDCVGTKALELMNPQERQADFNAELPQTRELMLTASHLCLKARLVDRCVAKKEGNEFQCICLIDKAVDAFTPAELEATLEQQSGGAWPARYSALRNDCFSRIP